jgi:hypothetical protein
MTYESIAAELYTRLPKLQPAEGAADQYGDLSDPNILFGSLLIPALEQALEAHDLANILKICAFLEDTSIAAATDPKLASLIKTEFAEWLGWAANEDLLAPWLGAETKRLCGYVPGLATQRLNGEEDVKVSGIRSRISSIWNRFSKR